MLKTYQIDLDHAAIFNRCMAYITENPRGTGQGPGGCSPCPKCRPDLYSYTSDNYKNGPAPGPHTWPELNNLLKLFSSPVVGSWFNVMVQHSCIREHIHNYLRREARPQKYVCVYYPHSLPEHPPFEYFDADENVWKTIQCLTGDYVIFPKMLKHRVGKQQSTVPRCSININI